MALRLVTPALAASALLPWLAGVDELALLFVLAAIGAASARLLAAVGAVADGRGARRTVVLACGGIVFLVAAGTLHVPLLVVGCTACAAIELLASPVVPVQALPEPVELAEAPTSRAA